jgi:hypothetical protein
MAGENNSERDAPQLEADKVEQQFFRIIITIIIYLWEIPGVKLIR